MKPKSYAFLTILMLVFFGFAASAQNEPEIKIDFKLTDQSSNTSRTYKLLAINYGLNNPYYSQDQSKLINTGSCNLILEVMQEADDFLLKWISGAIKNASGAVTIVTANGVKKPRNISFTGAQVASASESFYSMGGANTSPQISIYIKTLSVDGVVIFTQ